MSLLGALTGIGKKVLDVVDDLVPDKDLANKLKSQLDLSKLTTDADIERIRIEAQRDVEIEIERTHQAALNQNDLQTKRARPDIARSSWKLTWWYTLLTIGSQVLSVLVAPFYEGMPSVPFDSVVFGTIAGPALWFMGIRSVERWKAGGTPR